MNSVTITLPLDPSLLCTAQQKKVSFGQRRIFTNPRVARTKRAVSILARPSRSAVHAAVPPGNAVRLDATYHYAYPKATPKKRLVDGAPKTNGADCDNVNKAVLDALGDDHGHGAGWWPDDRLVCDLRIRKVYTLSAPRITFVVSSASSPTPDAAV